MAAPVDKSARRWPERAMSTAARLARIEGLAARVAALETENAALRVRVGMLEAENAALKADNATLRGKLGRPPKTPGNSGTPPSRGHKANGAAEARPKGKVHAGAHRPLHPEPTRRRDVFAERCPHCRAALAAAGQAPLQAYDRIDIPRITPDVTRVTLHGGTCPCCHGRFKAAPPAGLAVRAELARPRPLPALRPGDPVRAPGAAAGRPVRARRQRGRAGRHAGR